MKRPFDRTRAVTPPSCFVAARILLLITALLLAVMPLTEHFWTFDHFLQGGQDFELTLLSMLVVLLLGLLLAHYMKETIAILLAFRKWLSFGFLRDDIAIPRFPLLILICLYTRSVPRPSLRLFNIPLQI